MSRKKVAIIGAGAAGLTSIKACLEEGLEPVCFERHDDIGGMWYYTDDIRPGQGAACYRSVVTNTSKEMVCFSDFPFPKEEPVYLPGKTVHRYLRDYAMNFGLLPYIHLKTKVVNVAPAGSYPKNGRWTAHTVTENSTGAEASTQIDAFDAVIVCNGIFNTAFTPAFRGLDQFQGVAMHSNKYRRPEPFRNKNVLVVGEPARAGRMYVEATDLGLPWFLSEILRFHTGSANSAGEIACELGGVANQVYLSMKPGTVLVPRLRPGGVPNDFLIRRALFKVLSNSMIKTLSEWKADSWVDRANFGVPCQADCPSLSYMVSDGLAYRLAAGQVAVKPEVEEFTSTGVVFTDKTSVKDLDAVIFATGYRVTFPFVDTPALSGSQSDLQFYKLVFPTRLEHPTLAIVGMVKPFGSPVFPVYEVQARWAALVLKGRLKLPERKVVLSQVSNLNEHVGLVYRDDIANQIGALPGFWRLLFCDPKLAFLYYFGPAFPAHYRLVGPHSWPEAASYSKEAYSNTYHGTSGGRRPSNGTPYRLKPLVFVVALLAVFLFYLHCFK